MAKPTKNLPAPIPDTPNVARGPLGGGDFWREDANQPVWAGWLQQLFANPIQSSALVVFAASAIGIVAVLLSYIPSADVENYELGRASDVLLTVLGAAGIVAVMTKIKSPLVSALGFVVLAALVIPTNDIMRFLLFFSGSDRSYTEFFGTTVEDTKQENGPARGIALEIYHELALQYDIAATDGGSRDPADIVTLIETEIQQARDRDTFDNAARFGAWETLVRLGSEGQDLVYRYSGDQAFGRNLAYLRMEGMIAFEYNDFERVALTRRGCNLLWTFAARSEVYPSCREFEVEREDGAGGLRLPNTVRVTEQSYRGEFEVPPEGLYLPFSVMSGGRYQIDVEPTQGGDPVTYLYNLGELIDNNDDGGRNYASQIVADLVEDGAYQIYVRDFGVVRDPMQVQITITRTGDSQVQIGQVAPGSCTAQIFGDVRPGAAIDVGLPQAAALAPGETRYFSITPAAAGRYLVSAQDSLGPFCMHLSGGGVVASATGAGFMFQALEAGVTYQVGVHNARANQSLATVMVRNSDIVAPEQTVRPPTAAAP